MEVRDDTAREKDTLATEEGIKPDSEELTGKLPYNELDADGTTNPDKETAAPEKETSRETMENDIDKLFLDTSYVTCPELLCLEEVTESENGSDSALLVNSAFETVKMRFDTAA
jgi:hypothetical protein